MTFCAEEQRLRALLAIVDAMILFCGLTTIDLVHAVPQLPERGSKAVASSASIDVGGPATNAARTAAALGDEARLLALIGTGPLASLARQLLHRDSIDVVDLATDGDPAVSAVAVTPDGERTVISTNNEGRSARVPTLSLLDGVSVLLVDGHLMEVQTKLAQAARNRHIPVVLDAGSYRHGIEALIGTCSHVVASSTFRFPDTPEVSGAELCERIADLGPDLAGQTHGPSGINIFTARKHDIIPVANVPASAIVDTLGAGDVMHGALATALARGLDNVDAVEFAGQLASRSVMFEGALGWSNNTP